MKRLTTHASLVSRHRSRGGPTREQRLAPVHFRSRLSRPAVGNRRSLATPFPLGTLCRAWRRFSHRSNRHGQVLGLLHVLLLSQSTQRTCPHLDAWTDRGTSSRVAGAAARDGMSPSRTGEETSGTVPTSGHSSTCGIKDNLLERTCQVRNRVRQSRTLGSVRGGAQQCPRLLGPTGTRRDAQGF